MSNDILFEVMRGRPDAEELAAVVAVLLARATETGTGEDPDRCTTARWRRLERTPGFCAPHSWQTDAG